MQALISRAGKDTRWFNIKADIGPAIATALVAAKATYDLQHQNPDFVMSELTIPALAAIVALFVYWLVANLAEFVWNLTQAGNRMEIERLIEAQPQFQELQKQILTVRNRATSAVSAFEVYGVDAAESKEAYDKYRDAADELGISGTVAGKEILKIISDGFTTFLGIHISRFANGGKVNVISADPADEQRLNFGYLEFVGRTAGRADETIEQLKRVLLR